jgi:hypothetical protein
MNEKLDDEPIINWKKSKNIRISMLKINKNVL